MTQDRSHHEAKRRLPRQLSLWGARAAAPRANPMRLDAS